METWSRHIFRSRLISKHCNDTQYDWENDPGIAYHAFWKARLALVLLIFLLPGLAACSEQYTPYRPPTFAVQVTPPLPLAKTSGTPVTSNPQTCIDDLAFLEDVSLPGGTLVTSGESLDKRWLVQNNGSCNWDETYRVRLVSGVALGAPTEQTLYPARAGAEVTLRMMLTAPTEPGTYQGDWQAFDPRGQAFGDILTLQVVVAPVQP